MNKWIYACVFIVIIIVAIFVGMFLFNTIDSNNNNLETYEIQNARTINTENKIETNIVDINVSAVEKEKTSPNALLVFKTHYEECNHNIQDYIPIPEEYVNLTSEELEEKYPGWTIETFYPHEITLMKNEEESCNEHYILREKDGVIVVYHVNDLNEEELEEETDISTEYLTEQDRNKLKMGIRIYGREELNSALEDYE